MIDWQYDLYFTENIQDYTSYSVQAQQILQNLVAVSLDLDLGSVSRSIGWNGNMLPITIINSTPTNAPPGGKGFVIKILGGVMTLYAWDGTAWIAK